jgi:hypothetical protein
MHCRNTCGRSIEAHSIGKKGVDSSPHRRPPSSALADEMPGPLDRRCPRGRHVPRAIRSTQPWKEIASKIYPEGHACRGKW